MRSFQWNLRSRLLLALTFGAIVAVTAAAQERGGAPQAPAPGAGRGTNPNAVGVVAFQPTEGMTTSRIRYEAGARTNWHTHTAPQMLWVEDGRGLWQERGDPVKDMLKDVAIVTRVYCGTITWGAPVSDAEYLGKK